MADETIEDIIRKNLVFKQAIKSNGFNQIYCEVCGDGARTKGPRGGWLFNNETAYYNCFNCNIDGSFDPNREFPFSKDMRRILDSFQIPKEEYEKILLKKVLDNKKPQNTIKRKADIRMPVIDIPDYFYALKDADNKIADIARTFLLNRKIDPDSYPFYLSTGISSANVKEEMFAKLTFNRLIIPAFKGKDMVYYQARALDEIKKPKYINPELPKSNYIYGYNNLFINVDNPLFITEGFFDSLFLNGVALMGNDISTSQIELIAKSPRRKIVIPDKKLNKKINDDGSNLAQKAIELGWEISLPDIGNCTDINKAIIKYGRLYVFKSIMDNIYSGFSARTALTFY